MITEYRENKACTISFDITEDIAGPVFIYYELSNFYQNHATWVAGCTCLLMLLFLISALRGRLTSVCLANVKWSGKTTTKNVHGARAACRPSPWRAHVWSSDDAIRHSGWLFFFFSVPTKEFCLCPGSPMFVCWSCRGYWLASVLCCGL